MNFQSQDEFRKFVEDEVKRHEINKILDKPTRISLLLRFSKHPLVAIAIGFLLTGVAGSLISDHLQSEAKKKELQRQAFSHIREFTQSVHSRLTESRYLTSAFRRGIVGEELSFRKKEYDASVKNWNVYLLSHLLTFREYSEAKSRMFFEETIEDHLGTVLRALDRCVTANYDSTNSEKSVNNGQRCYVTDGEENFSVDVHYLIRAADECTYEITSALFHFVSLNLKVHDQSWSKSSPAMMEVFRSSCTDEIVKNIDELLPDERPLYRSSNLPIPVQNPKKHLPAQSKNTQ